MRPISLHYKASDVPDYRGCRKGFVFVGLPATEAQELSDTLKGVMCHK